MEYRAFLSELDKRLEEYFKLHKEHIYCKEGCSACCEKGDYPMSLVEYSYLIKGYTELDNSLKPQVQKNIEEMERGGKCPFLIEKHCSVYPYRPIICRVHGLAYLCKDGLVKVPYCVNEGKNYSDVYENNEIVINPISENLDTQNVLSKFEDLEFRNLYDWIKNE